MVEKKKRVDGAGRIMLWSSLFLMLWSSPIQKKKKHGFSLSLSHVSVGNSALTLQEAWLWISIVVVMSWRVALGGRRLSPKGIWDRLQPKLSDYPCLLVLGLASRSLNHSLMFFPQPQSNLCSHLSCTEWSLQWQEGSLICPLGPVLYMPKLPVLNFCWMNLYDWLLQTGHCEADTITSMWGWVTLLTYLTCFEYSKIPKRAPN